ncbi:hypothetical protein SAMN06296378_0001, partial [Salinibacterium xinjiangense]
MGSRAHTAKIAAGTADVAHHVRLDLTVRTTSWPLALHLVLNAKQPPWLFFNSWGGYFTMESGGVLLSH